MCFYVPFFRPQRVRHRRKRMSKSPSDLTKVTHSQGASNLSPASSLTRLERKSQKQQLLQQQQLLASGVMTTAFERTQTSLESSDSLTAADVSGHILSTDENVI